MAAAASMAATRLADGESIEIDGRLDEAVWSRATSGGRLHADRPEQRPARHRANRGPHRVRQRRAVPGRDGVRLGARYHHRETAQARRAAVLRRQDPMDHRHVPRRAHRLLLRNESRRGDGGRAHGQHRPEPRLGRRLDRQGAAQRDRLDARGRASVPHVQLQSEQRHVGLQHRAHASIATTRSASGWDGCATRGCSGWRMPG